GRPTLLQLAYQLCAMHNRGLASRPKVDPFRLRIPATPTVQSGRLQSRVRQFSTRNPGTLLSSLALAIVLVAGPSRFARADDTPTTRAGRYSPYEQASIDQALAKLGSELDPAPEGKTIEGIDVVSYDVIEPR